MSELLKFGCPAPNCGRRFFTKEKLENHIKLRHPLLSFSSTPSNEAQTKIDKKEENKKMIINNETKATNQSIPSQNIINTKEQKKHVDEVKEIKNNEIKKEINPAKNNINPPQNKQKQQNIIQTKIENKNNEINKIQENEKKTIKNNNSKKNININLKKESSSSMINNKEKAKEKKIKKNKSDLKTKNIEKEINKTIEEIENKINETDKIDNDTKNIKNKETKNIEEKEKKKKLEKEKHKIILDNLNSKINSLENYFENETLELKKQFELSEIPVFEDIVMENEEDKEKDKGKETTKSNSKIDLPNQTEESTKEVSKNNNSNLNIKTDINKEKENDNIDKDNDNDNYALTEEQRKYDIGKVIEITDEMVFEGTKFEDYSEFIELDLSKKNIALFMNNRNITFE